MTKATDLTDALEACLEQITVANGFATTVAAVYGFGKAKPDSAPTPCLLVRIAEDATESNVGKKCKRHVQYEVEGILARSATLQDLQRLHHDVLRAIGFGDILPARLLVPGEAIEESAEFDTGSDGSTGRRVISRIALRYIETY